MGSNGDLISRSALKRYIQENGMVYANKLDEFPAVDAVPVEALGKWGKLLLPYKGDPRGPVGRMGDGHLEGEALYWGVVTDADGGRWVPVYEEVLLELIERAKANDPESLRPKGRWTENRRKEFSVAIGGDVCWFTYTCSECGGETMNDYQYCPNCGADMTDNKGEIDK